jgi:hypothetical protein
MMFAESLFDRSVTHTQAICRHTNNQSSEEEKNLAVGEGGGHTQRK